MAAQVFSRSLETSLGLDVERQARHAAITSRSQNVFSLESFGTCGSEAQTKESAPDESSEAAANGGYLA